MVGSAPSIPSPATLSATYPWAQHHRSTARIRWRTRRAVSGRRVQISVRRRNTSSPRMWSTVTLPRTGNAWRSSVTSRSLACLRFRQRGRSASHVRNAACRKVGGLARRFAASASLPERASRRFSNAWARASARVTSRKPPNPRSWRRPRIGARWVKNPTPGTGFTSAVPQTQSNSARFVALRATVPTGGRRSLASAPLPLFDARRDGSHPAVWRFPCRPPAAGCADRRSAFPCQRAIRLVVVRTGQEWWRRRESNPRPKVFRNDVYMHIRVVGGNPRPKASFPLSVPRRINPANRGSEPIPCAHRRLGKTAGKARLGRRPFPPGRRGQEERGYLSSQCQFSVGFCFVSTVYERWTPDMQSLLHIPSSNPVRPPSSRD